MSLDPHLWPVLERATLEELEPIAELLHEKDIVWSWDRSMSLNQLRGELHRELRLNGGNSIANFFRGEGVSWAELVRDVAKKVKVPLCSDTVELERRVLLRLLERAIERMTPAQLEALRDELERKGLPRDLPLTGGALVALLVAGNLAGFAAYQFIVIVSNAVVRALIGRGLALATNAALTRGLSLALGPLGWLLTLLLTLVDLAGPAYRITIPAVVLVGALRAAEQADGRL